MKATLLSSLVFFAFIISSCSKNGCTIKSDNLILEVNNQLEVRVNSAKCKSNPLTKEFSASEYLIARGFEAKQFGFENMELETISDLHGKGTKTNIRGVYKKDGYQIEKHLSITTYEAFPGMAFFRVAYINSGQKNIDVTKWVNNNYSVDSNGDNPAFWSFQGGSSNRRADWILPVDSAFSQENFMGMTNTDYGGGIPVTDIWRRDAGIAVGHVELVPRFVSLPFYKDQYSSSASICVEYNYPEVQHFLSGDTLQTYETFVSVHTGDCYNTLTEYTRYMQSGGIKFIPDEPFAFEPVWCAWGYWQKFTMEQIRGTLQKVKDLGIKWVDIDDGYQITEGDWNIAPKRFPNGEKDMRSLVDKIHSMGMKAKIWWAPLAADPGSELITKNPDIIIRNKDGAPQYITGWECYYLSPTYKKTIDHTKSLLKMYLQDWDYDGLKMDGMHINSVGPDYNSNHELEAPEQSNELLPLYFKTVYETAILYKPHAVLQNCPCGCVVSYYNLPFMNQAVASDPTSSWQTRLKGKTYKALRPGIAYYGDHIELSDGGMDFATQIGVGAVPGTKFTWPEGSFKLTPEKEAAMKKWITIYNREMISKETYLGSLYDIGYDKPETHVIQKGDTLYYAFYNKDWNGEIELRGLKEIKYTIVDYENDKMLGQVDGVTPVSNFLFKNHLLVKVFPSDK